MALAVTGLTDAIESAFSTEWSKAKGGKPPEAGKDDRRLMFAAVARGILQHLAEQQSSLIASLKLTPPGSDTSTNYGASDTALNISLS